MGFRSTITSYDWRYQIPAWFLEKHPMLQGSITEKGCFFPLSSKSEKKFYSQLNEEEVFLDIQKILIELKITSIFVVVLLHECGGITRVEISQETIQGMEPTGWKQVEEVEHNYCYGCSDCKNIK